MPLSRKGRKVMRAMKRQYGSKEGERVFYASEKNISGVHRKVRKARQGAVYGINVRRSGMR